ncbi:MAG: T9SS type A sorting domain-containing protein [Chitinophagaceae bacterium]|nr:T9SS type A sorting domain-containing protein [Chitinophagaceae bacterium]
MNFLNISGNYKNLSYSISDINGRIIKNEIIGDNTKIKLAEINSGLYIINILVDGQSSSHMIEIKKP